MPKMANDLVIQEFFLWGAMISRLHRTQRIPNMNIEGRLFIVLSLCHAGPYKLPTSSRLCRMYDPSVNLSR